MSTNAQTSWQELQTYVWHGCTNTSKIEMQDFTYNPEKLKNKK